MTLFTLAELLPTAQAHGFAVGAFSPRYPSMIPPVLRAGEALESPLIVQISQKDMSRCGVEVEAFAAAFFAAADGVGVPIALHLDHTEDEAIIARAVAAGFSSVMIDASEAPLAENIRRTRAVADFAHARGVSVEGELGTIGAFGFSETEAKDEASLTDPAAVLRFVAESGVDALAVSVGTVHGVRTGREIAIDLAHLARLRAETEIPLVLHGGSGIRAEVLRAAVALPGGGVSKVNLATDLELAMLRALGSERRLTDDELETYSAEQVERAQAAVEAVVREKIERFLLSAGQAARYRGAPASR